FLGAAVFAFIAIVIFALMSEAASGTTFNTDIAQGMKPVIAGAGFFFGILLLFGAAIWVFLGVVLWRLKNWARIVTIVLAGNSLFLCGTGALLALLSGWVLLLLLLLVGGAVDFWIIWYLRRPDVK